MKATRFFAMAALAGLVAFTSCSVNDDIQDNAAVRFTAGIDGATAIGPESRAAGSEWASGDAIGIFMTDGAAAVLAANKHYTTTGASAFTAVTGDELYYPMDGGTVGFIAYYPYASGTALGNINVTIGDQTDQPSFDLLYSSGATGSKASTTPVALTFEHKLAKIVMNCTADASVGTALTGMTVTIKGMNTANTFDLSTGTLGTPGTVAAITPRTVADGSEYDAIIMPGSYLADVITVEFTVGTDTFTWNVGATSFEGGNEYSYDVTLTRTGVNVTGTITPWIISGNNRGDVTAE